jgi:hypothetical protein
MVQERLFPSSPWFRTWLGRFTSCPQQWKLVHSIYLGQQRELEHLHQLGMRAT